MRSFETEDNESMCSSGETQYHSHESNKDGRPFTSVKNKKQQRREKWKRRPQNVPEKLTATREG